MSKDARVVVRIEAAIDEWIGHAAGALGLDKAAYVRMLIYREKNAAMAPFQMGLLVPKGAASGPGEITRLTEPGGDIAEPADEVADPADNIASTLDARLIEAATQAVERPAPYRPAAQDDLSHETAIAAYPLMRVGRPKYNPGRDGRG